MSVPPLLGRASPIRSTVQHSRGLTRRGDFHLERERYTTAPVYWSATIDTQEPQRLESSTGDSYRVSVAETLQLPCCPVIPAPPLVRNSSPVGYLSGEPGTARVARSSDYFVGENRASAISNTYDYITDHDTSLPPPYTSLPPPYAVEQSSGHPRESGNVSTFGYLGSNFAGPTTGPGLIRSLRDRASGQVIGLDASWPWISDPLLPLLQEPHPLDNFIHGNIPPPPERTRITMQPTEQIHPRIPFPYECPIPFQSNWTSYSTSDRYISSQNTSSWSPQEHLTYPLPVHPHDVTPGFHGIDTGSKTELHTSGTLDSHSAQVFGNHPSHTLSDHKMHLFRSAATYISDYHTTGGRVDDCRHFDELKFNTEQIIGLGPQLPLSPRKLLSQDRASRIKGRRRSRTFHHTHRSATTRSRPTRLPKAHSVCCHHVSKSCGWRDDEGKKCAKPISYDDCPGHFATAHGIRNKAWNVKVICRWCPSEPYKVVTRKNFLRHMKEVHFCFARSENGN